MYLEYWQLAAKPFEPMPADTAFYYPGESAEGALSKLLYAVREGRGAAALAGPSGVGKTLLVNRLTRQLGAEEEPATVIHLVFPEMSSRDLLAYLAERLGAPATDSHAPGSIEESVRRLEALADANAGRKQRPVVVIDEAHLLEDCGALETLRLVTNFRSGGKPAFTLLLVGQMGLLSAVGRRPTLDERLDVKTLLRGFTAEETGAYIRHRLLAAGAERELFTGEGLQQAFALTGGYARRIDRLCDLALVVGFAERKPEIGAAELESVHRELVALGAP
ncbi:AAA family ATPase [Botrimarina sp.]|uniref:ExeA family protein n=1 Tax=Botrimarina sp. TaxID=2795802 RepID=UPI0032EBEBC0